MRGCVSKRFKSGAENPGTERGQTPRARQNAPSHRQAPEVWRRGSRRPFWAFSGNAHVSECWIVKLGPRLWQNGLRRKAAPSPLGLRTKINTPVQSKAKAALGPKRAARLMANGGCVQGALKSIWPLYFCAANAHAFRASHVLQGGVPLRKHPQSAKAAFCARQATA